MILDMKAHKTDCVISPSHHTSVLQAADAKDGSISTMQKIIHGTLEKHFMSGNKHISAAQLAWVVQDASRRVPADVYRSSLERVGWRITNEGLDTQKMEYEPLSVIRPEKLGTGPAPNATRSGLKIRADPAMQAAAAAAAAVSPAGDGDALLAQAAAIVRASRTSSVPKDTQSGRGGTRVSYNKGGLHMTAQDHIDDLVRVEAEKDAQAKKSTDRHLAYVFKWLKILTDADAKLASSSSDFKKLSNTQLIAYILAREGKQPTKKDKSSMATLASSIKHKTVTLGKCAICLEKLDEYRRMIEDGAEV